MIFDQARMFNPSLGESHEQWRAQVRRFVDTEVMPHAETWDEAGSLPDDLWPKAAGLGILQLGYPEAYGGVTEGTDIWHAHILTEELSRAGLGGMNASLMVHGIGLPPVLGFASDALKEQIAPPVLAGEQHISLAITEPSGGSDVASLKTTARRDGDHYIVNGSKTFITGGMRADWYTVAVRTGGDGAGGVSIVLIPATAEGFSRTALERKQGWWCSDTATLYFDDVRVPVSQLIGEENKGFRVIMANFNSERMGMSVGMEAFSRVCLEEAISWARERTTFGARLIDHQVIRHKVAEMQQRIHATQAFIQACTTQLMHGCPDPAAIALLKVQASETMEFCAREAMQILGGAGYLRGNRVERIYREVRVNAIGGGSEEIMRDLAARQMGL